MARLDSIQIALPADVGGPSPDDPTDTRWRTGFFKQPVRGPVTVTPETIVGDGVADRKNHGGPDKAILGYSAEHYAGWRSLLGPDAGGGGFGENLTLAGQTEQTVCVGDAYAVGPTVVLEVSQPRQPCWKLGRRWHHPDLPTIVMATGRTGWYFRVRTVGEVTVGDAVRLLDRPHERLTVAALNDMMYGRRPPSAEAADCPALAAGWRAHLWHRLRS